MATEEGDGKGGSNDREGAQAPPVPPLRFEWLMKTNVARLLKSDIAAVLAEFQRQKLCPSVHQGVARKRELYGNTLSSKADQLLGRVACLVLITGLMSTLTIAMRWTLSWKAGISRTNVSGKQAQNVR